MMDKLNPKNAWIIPIICWTVSITVAILHLPLGVFGNFALAAAQLILFVIASYIGMKVLSNRESEYSKNDKIHASIGLGLVGVTLLLIIAAIMTQ